MSNGKYERVRKGGFPTKTAANQWLKSLSAPSAPTIAVVRQHTTDEMYAEWSRYHFQGITENKARAYRLAWDRLKPLHGLALGDVTYELAQQAVDACGTYYPCRDAKTVINGIFTTAKQGRHVDYNPAEYIKLPAQEKKPKTGFSEAAVALMWERLDDVPFLCYPLIMIYTGMRPNEQIKLRNEQIDFSCNEIRGAGSKTELGRELPIVFPDKIVPLLRQYVPFGSDRSVFYDKYAEALAQAGIEYLPPNCCRHTCASLLTKKGVAPSVIQRIMRHTSYKTTLGYTHLDSGDAVDGVNKL